MPCTGHDNGSATLWEEKTALQQLAAPCLSALQSLQDANAAAVLAAAHLASSALSRAAWRV